MPVANTKLLVEFQAGMAQGFEAYALSDSLGRFSFYGGPTGRRTLYWAVPGGRGAKRWFALTNVDFQRGVDVDLGDLEAVEIEVTVELLFADETIPLDRWDVSLCEPREGSLSRQVGQLRPRRDRPDPFVFGALSAGQYDVAVSREGYPAIRVRLEIAPGQTQARTGVTIPSGDYRFSHSRLDSPLARVRLAAGGHETVRIEANPVDEHGYLRVRIVMAEGLPLATPDVWLERDGRVVEPYYHNDDATTFAAGPGTYTLCAHYPGFRSVRRSVELKTREGRTMQEILEPLVIIMHGE